jgi:hypothetical protein
MYIRLRVQILGQILVALSFASSYFELGDCAECIRFAKKSINDIVAECNYLIKSTPGKCCNLGRPDWSEKYRALGDEHHHYVSVEGQCFRKDHRK